MPGRACPVEIASDVTDRLLERLGVREGDTESLIAAGPRPRDRGG